MSVSGEIRHHGAFVVLAAQGGAAPADRWVNSWHWDELVGLVVARVLSLLPLREAGGAGVGGAEATKGAEVLGTALAGVHPVLSKSGRVRKIIPRRDSWGHQGGWGSPRAATPALALQEPLRCSSRRATPCPQPCVCPPSSAEPRGGVGRAVGPVSREAAGEGAESDAG